MQTVVHLAELRETISRWRAAGQRVALVPTMGALHAGHLALVATARAAADRTVVSIFVNPRQFAPGEDLARYPRREAADAALLRQAGCDLLWMPSPATMYPPGFATEVSVGGIGDILDGSARPGHFTGVATVVLKLFNQVRPDLALFGEKDFQQLAVIRQLVRDLDLDIAIEAAPTERDDDGLALSSRNAYLAAEERSSATALPRAIGRAARSIGSGGDPDEALAAARAALVAAGFTVDYVALVDAETLREPTAGRPRRLLAAARLGSTRLIDNVAVDVEQS